MSRPSRKRDLGTESELLVAFVNTRDFEERVDAIGSPGALEGWIARSGAEIGSPPVDVDGHRRALALRESLRAVLRANNGGEATKGELAALLEAVRRARFKGALAGGGSVDIKPAGEGVGALEARLLLAMERLQAGGEWERLKACPAQDCQWAFVDTSRNRSRTWCSMDVCGNRSKTRRYRSRRSAG